MPWRDTFTSLIKKPTQQWIYATIPASRTPMGETGADIYPGKSYVRIKLTQMYLGYQRVWVHAQAPVVHAFPRFLHGRGYVEVPIVVGPNRLRDNFEGQPLQRVVSLNQTVVGPVPFLGGDFDLVIALFAAQTKNYAEQFLDLLGSLSGLVPNAELTTALGLLRPMERGLEQMLGLGDLTLQIGVQDTFSSPSGGEVSNPLRSGYRVLIAKEQTTLDPSQLWLTQRGLCVERNGQPGDLLADCDYIVFHIEGLGKRDWRELPSLSLAWGKVEEAVGTGNEDAIDRAFEMYKWTLLGNGDLLAKDRLETLKEQVAELQTLLQAGQTNLKGFLPQSARITPSVAELFESEVIQATQVKWHN